MMPESSLCSPLYAQTYSLFSLKVKNASAAKIRTSPLLSTTTESVWICVFVVL